jgi:hypothetical protein
MPRSSSDHPASSALGRKSSEGDAQLVVGNAPQVMCHRFVQPSKALQPPAFDDRQSIGHGGLPPHFGREWTFPIIGGSLQTEGRHGIGYRYAGRNDPPLLNWEEFGSGSIRIRLRYMDRRGRCVHRGHDSERLEPRYTSDAPRYTYRGRYGWRVGWSILTRESNSVSESLPRGIAFP